MHAATCCIKLAICTCQDFDRSGWSVVNVNVHRVTKPNFTWVTKPNFTWVTKPESTWVYEPQTLDCICSRFRHTRAVLVLNIGMNMDQSVLNKSVMSCIDLKQVQLLITYLHMIFAYLFSVPVSKYMDDISKEFFTVLGACPSSQ